MGFDLMHEANIDPHSLRKQVDAGRRPKVSPQAAAAAAAAARGAKHAYLLAVQNEQITVHDVVLAALSAEGRPLRRIKLKQLLLAHKDFSEQRAYRLLTALAESLELQDFGEVVRSADIGWLIDARTGGKRLMAWQDLLSSREVTCPGFPFASAFTTTNGV